MSVRVFGIEFGVQVLRDPEVDLGSAPPCGRTPKAPRGSGTNGLSRTPGADVNSHQIRACRLLICSARQREKSTAGEETDLRTFTRGIYWAIRDIEIPRFAR